ncbi:MAG: hypothetical protein J1F38_01325 [Muribaculaceae bacterium]|nr:hypothetical protein [Muribaculaceae bacterium]
MNRLIYLIITILALNIRSLSFAEDFSFGKWSISHDSESHTTKILKNGEPILKDVMPLFKVSANLMGTENHDKIAYSSDELSDEVGKGKKFLVTYSTTRNNLPEVEQAFYLYENKDFILTDVTLVGNNGGEVSSNYISPIFSESPNLFLPKDNNNVFLTVPFDNDGFIEYSYFPLSCSSPGSKGKETGRLARDSISFEVTAIFNTQTDQGLVVGSVDHDTWKSAIRIKGSPLSEGTVNRLECVSGITHAVTHDTNGDYLQPHGTVTGKRVKSARMMIHYSDNWCEGMETFGEVCALISGKAKYDGPVPYGWNSWGGMATNVNFEGVMSVSDYMKENIQDKGGFGDGVVYIDLDSWWSGIDWDRLKIFCDHCYENGQVPGIYWYPWCDFLWADSGAVEGNNGYVYNQGYLRVNGQVKGLCGAACMDPTAPATISRMNYFIDRFKMLGFKYIKLDFLTNGIVEADSYWKEGITTGVQAYNYGMKKFRERCGDDMFIVESISPLFPAQYANARRVSCDAWGEMYHIGHCMNGYSFGWWLNKVYNYLDPDHLVMGDRTTEEHISRMTTGAVTGFCILGDNLSTAGSYVGNPQYQREQVKYATVKEVNDIIKMGGGFRPAGGKSIVRYRDQYSGYHDEINVFYKETDDSYVVIYFNYSHGDNYTDAIDLTSLGIDSQNVDISKSYECWTKAPVTVNDNKINFSDKNNTARIFRLYKK